MEKILTLISPILEKLSLSRVLQFGLLIFFCLLGYIGFLYVPSLIENVSDSTETKQFVQLTPTSKDAAAQFMRKYKGSALYMTVLRFEFSRNLRVPIYRLFNNKDIEKLIMDRLNGGDGALPIFIKNDNSNNSQMVSMIEGEYRCDPFDGGGLARVWPDLIPRFTMSCRVSIPPSFDGGLRGYIVVHFNKPLSTYELDAIRIDLLLLAKTIYNQ